MCPGRVLLPEVVGGQGWMWAMEERGSVGLAKPKSGALTLTGAFVSKRGTCNVRPRLPNWTTHRRSNSEGVPMK